MKNRTPITRPEELPSDGMITVLAWDGERRRGYHVEKILYVNDDFATVLATPYSVSTSRMSAEPQSLHLRFGLDTIEAMP